MDFKLLGSILLIIGTTIGAGMLALPIATAQLGFLGSLVLLCGCWFVMTAGAFLVLEVNLWLPQNSHIISMARVTLGPLGQVVAWVTYLLLLYSLLAAYIAGGSDLFHGLLSASHVEIPATASAVLFTFVLGSVVYLGIRSIDYANRVMMFIKMTTYLFLVALLTPIISLENLSAGNWLHITSATAVMVTITSFGYSPIIPSLRVYFGGDIKKLKKAILIGSLIPLVCYILWDMVIMGVIPLESANGLIAILKSENSTSELVRTLDSLAPFPVTTLFIKVFTSICVVTSFFGVALCLADFLADGMSIEKKGKGNFIVQMATLLPPLIIVLFFPGIFIKALQYAGIYCVILLMLLPALMAWSGRYRRNMAGDYQVRGGKILLRFLILLSLMLIILAFF